MASTGSIFLGRDRPFEIHRLVLEQLRGLIDAQVDVRAVPAASYGAALLYFTGSKAHNIALRAHKHENILAMTAGRPTENEQASA